MLEHFFQPSSIAVVGASRTPGKVGHDTLRNLIDAGFEGPIAIHNGELDSQTPAAREFDVVRAGIAKFSSKPRLTVHEGKGHSLGPHPTRGPIAADSLQLLVQDVLDIWEP